MGQVDGVISTNAKQLVGQDLKNKNCLCASHARQQQRHLTVMCNSTLSNYAKSFFIDLSRTQIFRLTSKVY